MMTRKVTFEIEADGYSNAKVFLSESDGVPTVEIGQDSDRIVLTLPAARDLITALSELAPA